MINFIIVACRISSQLKGYNNYKNRLRLAKVIVKNKMSRFSLVQCVECVRWGEREAAEFHEAGFVNQQHDCGDRVMRIDCRHVL